MSCLQRPGLAAAALVLAALAGCGVRPPDIDSLPTLGRPPNLRPDYAGVTIPPNIAPLNFTVREEGAAYFARVSGAKGEAIEVASDGLDIRLPARQWRRLLEANAGGDVDVDVAVRDDSGTWTRFDTVTNHVALEAIDPYLAYREIDPAYNFWLEISIHQRSLASFGDRTVVDSMQFDAGCVNCHSFRSNHTDRMTLGIRSSKHGSSTVMVRDGDVEKIGTKFGYTAWHPSGLIVCYSANEVHQFFHSARPELRDVVDLDSELLYYDLRTQKVVMNPKIAEFDRLETYPTWTPDGKFLYFCSAAFPWQNRHRIPPENFDECRYDLRRISYDVDSDTWGEPETVLSSEDTGQSILLPRISPDGRWLLFCMCDYGCFPIYQPSSDLYMMDLQTDDYQRLGINSDLSESWHSWSSNGRWIVFSSKRGDGLFTRPYFSYVDETGLAHKPFIMPQKDPAFYDSFLKTHSLPEFICEPVPARSRAIAETVTSPWKVDVESPVNFLERRGTGSADGQPPGAWMPAR